MEMQYDMKGTKDMLKKMSNFGTKVSKNAPAKAIREGSKPIIKAMRANAPVRSGKLKRRIGLRIKKYSKDQTTVGVVGVKYLKESPKYLDPAVYSVVNEFIKFTRHKPFMEKSFRQAKMQARAELFKQVQKDFVSEARKVAVR